MEPYLSHQKKDHLAYAEPFCRIGFTFTVIPLVRVNDTKG